jgi:flavin reductase (DIM6/NTAB) family NADH-FMN oxidoreductase RutF/catechol 2,3-dioxygenase-like lactoylglutathione lyase family enzyme
MSEEVMSSVATGLPNLRAAYLSAMRKVAATIALVTTREAGVAYGMAATAISSLSADPPAILVCINRAASMHGPLSRVKHFCINLLGEQHDSVFREFAARQGSTRFDFGEWTDGPHFLPCLTDATATLVCSLEQQVDYGTHTICIGRVESARFIESSRPLLFQDGGSGGFLPFRAAAAPAAAWRIGNIIYPVTDMDRAVKFYRDGLGLQLKFRDGSQWAAFDCCGVTLALERVSSTGSPQRIKASLKASGDFEAMVHKLSQSGAMVGAVQTGAHERTAMLADPDGNPIVLYAPLHRAQA